MRVIDLMQMSGAEALMTQRAIALNVVNPTIMFSTLSHDWPTITVGYKENVDRIDLEKVWADKIKVIRQSSNGRVALFSNNRQLCVSIIVRRGQYGDNHKLFRSHMGLLLQKAMAIYGIAANWSGQNVETGHASCFRTTGIYDMVGYVGKVITTTMGHIENAMVFDAVVALDDTILEIDRYLKVPVEGASVSSIERELGDRADAKEIRDVIFTVFAQELEAKCGVLTLDEAHTKKRLMLEVTKQGRF